jgi:intraflagellar transport protein 81
MSAAELKLIVERLAGPPFSKTWSVIQIHDEVPPGQLIISICDILAFIDEGNQKSIFKIPEARAQPEFINSLVDFLAMLKFKDVLEDRCVALNKGMHLSGT